MSGEDGTYRAWRHRRPPAYEVGYGKPPVSGRFKPGQSGNPNGRPRGSKNRRRSIPGHEEERLKAIILQEAYRRVQVSDPKGPLTIPMAQAIVRSLAVNAAKGHQRSQALFTDLLGTTERERRRLHDAWMASAIAYKLGWDRELERRRTLGIRGPDPLPHPDHVLIDLEADTVRIVGPVTREEKAEWDALRLRQQGAAAELRYLEALLDRSDCVDQDGVRADIAQARHVIDIGKRLGLN